MCNRCSDKASVYVVTSFGQEHVCPLCAVSLIRDGQVQRVAEFVKSKWTIEAEWKSRDSVAGYVTEASSAKTRAFNDPAYPSFEMEIPPRVYRKMLKLMELLMVHSLRYFPGHRYV